MDSFLKKLNKLAEEKPLISLKDLSEDPQLILAAQRCSTRYGERICVELDNCKMFLGDHCSNLTDGELKEMEHMRIQRSSMGVRFLPKMLLAEEEKEYEKVI